MPLIEKSRAPRQRALAGYESESPAQPVGEYQPTPTHVAGGVVAWSDGEERVEVHRARTRDGEVFEVLVTTQWGTKPIATEAEESAATQAAKRYMRGIAPENTCQTHTNTHDKARP